MAMQITYLHKTKESKIGNKSFKIVRAIQ